MSLDNMVGGAQVQSSPDISQSGVDKTGSVSSKAFSRTVSIESDVQATEGLKSDQPKPEFPSLRERITTPVDSSKTRSVRKLAGKVANKMVPDRLQEGVSSLKAKASKKAHAVAEAVTSKAQALKSATIGKLLRAIRNENFSKVDSGATQNPKLQEKIEQHNSGVDKLADLKTQLKNEEKGLKAFRSDFKEALELLEHPEKFTASSKPRTISIPGGETRTISAGDTATRGIMVGMIKEDIMGSSEYQNYERKMSQKAAGGTEFYHERQALKSEMKARAQGMVEMFKEEISRDLEADMEDVEKRREEFTDEHTRGIAERGGQYEQRTQKAKARMEAKEKAVDDLKEERTLTRNAISDARKAKKKSKNDASDLRSTAERMSSATGKRQTEESAAVVQKEYDRLKTGVGKAKGRMSEIPDELKTERKARKEARKEFKELDSGKARKKDVKDSTKEWETRDKEFDREAKQLEKQAKKKTGDFKKGLG